MTPAPLTGEGRGEGKRASRYALAVGGIVAVVAASLGLLLLPIPYAAIGDYGYLGVFLITLLATGAVVAPVPYLAAIVIAGSFLNPLGVAVVAGVASAIGELTGYGAGRAGRLLLPDTRWRRALERAMSRFGAVVVFAAALVPNPLFDAVGLTAGAARVPIFVFLLACFLGKTLRFWALAALGQPMLGGLL